jgi:hypothetical protein
MINGIANVDGWAGKKKGLWVFNEYISNMIGDYFVLER